MINRISDKTSRSQTKLLILSAHTTVVFAVVLLLDVLNNDPPIVLYLNAAILFCCSLSLVAAILKWNMLSKAITLISLPLYIVSTVFLWGFKLDLEYWFLVLAIISIFTLERTRYIVGLIIFYTMLLFLSRWALFYIPPRVDADWPESFSLIRNLVIFVGILVIIVSIQLKRAKTVRTLTDYTRIVRTLIGVLGHDLRGPVGLTKNLSTLLLEDPDIGKKSKDYREVINSIQTSSSTAAIILENILGWVMAEEPDSEPKTAVFDLTELITEEISNLDYFLKDRNRIIRFNTNSTLNIASNRELVRILIRNLLMNALRHSEGDSEIVLELGIDNKQVLFIIENKADQWKFEKLSRLLGDEPVMNDEQGFPSFGLYLCRTISRRLNIGLSGENPETDLIRVQLTFPPNQLRPDRLRQ